MIPDVNELPIDEIHVLPKNQVRYTPVHKRIGVSHEVVRRITGWPVLGFKLYIGPYKFQLVSRDSVDHTYYFELVEE